MLKFRLAMDQIVAGSAKWRCADGRWTAGASWFEPFRNPALEHVLMIGAGSVVVIVRERTADGFGREVVPDATDEMITAAIQQTAAWPADFVMVTIGRANLEVTCGRWGSAPLYLAAAADTLMASWDFLDLRDQLTKASLDEPTILRRLALQPRYAATTICRNVRRLTERARASWAPGKPLRIDSPPPAVHYRPRELRDDRAVLPLYGELLRAAIGQRAITGNDVVLELSGGTDSATVALAAREVWPNAPLASYGLLVGGPAGAQQVMRRDALSALARLSDVTINALEHPPLAPLPAGALVAPFEEPYRDAVEAALRVVPHPVVLTGIGGDELFALRPDERKPSQADERREASPSGDFFTSGARELIADLAVEPEELPPSVLPESALLALLVRAPVFLRAGRWPVSPLCAPELIRFGEWLPRRWREGKRLPREWLADRGVPPEVVWPRLRENFAAVMQAALRGNGLMQLERTLREGSVLVDLGYIDPDVLVRFLERARADTARSDDIDMRVHEFLALERELATLL